MIVCQVDAQFFRMGEEHIEQELMLIKDVLEAIGGKLLDAFFDANLGYVVARVCAGSELMVSDLFECTAFSIEKITYLGVYNKARRDSGLAKDRNAPRSPRIRRIANSGRQACGAQAM